MPSAVAVAAAAAADVGAPPPANKTGGDAPNFHAPSRMSTPGSEHAAVAAAAAAGAAANGDLPLEGGRAAAGGPAPTGRPWATERHPSVGGTRALARAPSSSAMAESGLSSFTAGAFVGGAGATSGLKRARDRRADRRKKKDPFEALEERLLDGFSLESITRQLQQQDETLQKGVRNYHTACFFFSRIEKAGRRGVLLCS